MRLLEIYFAFTMYLLKMVDERLTFSINFVLSKLTNLF